MSSIGATFISQHLQARRERVSLDLSRRHELYGQLIEEAMPLFVDAIGRTQLDPAKVLRLYSVVARIRLVSSSEVLRGAENVVADVIKSYASPIRDVNVVIQNDVEKHLDPLHAFTAACRRERDELLRKL